MSRSGVCLIGIPVRMWEGYEREAKFEGMTEKARECTVPNVRERALNVEPLSSDPEFNPIIVIVTPGCQFQIRPWWSHSSQDTRPSSRPESVVIWTWGLDAWTERQNKKHDNGWWDRAGWKRLDRRIDRNALGLLGNGGQILKRNPLQVEGGYMKQSRPH